MKISDSGNAGSPSADCGRRNFEKIKVGLVYNIADVVKTGGVTYERQRIYTKRSFTYA